MQININFKKITAILLICSFVFLTACFSKKNTDGLNGLSEADSAAQREGRYGEGTIPMAEGDGMFKDIHFGYNSSNVEATENEKLQYNVQVLQSNPAVKVQLEGHCDERGTTDFNLALGSQRAKSVQDFLISMGVDASRFEVISYGEELPLDPMQSEEAYAKNRRVHFTVK